MKKLFIIIITTFLLAIIAATPVMATTYDFGGADPGTFGKPTSVEPATVVGGTEDESSNINRSKDSTIIPPPFGSPDSNTPDTGELLTPNISGVIINYSNYGNPSVVNNGNSGNGTPYYPESSVEPNIPPSANISYSANNTSSTKFTLPDGLYYADGSIGTLSIPKLNVTGKVFEDESLENLSKGIGHFKFTSCWDGNVGFAAHNRGLSVAFGKIHTLSAGDKIIYSTKLGTRTYEVYSVSQIKETDMSKLQRTNENIVTLITCVNDKPELRWCVQAREIK